MSIVALTKFRISCSKRKIFKILTLKIPQQNKSVEKNGFTKADRVGFTKSVKTAFLVCYLHEYKIVILDFSETIQQSSVKNCYFFLSLA